MLFFFCGKKVLWDLFVSFIIMWSVIEVTYRLGFDQPASGGWVVLSYFVDVVFAVDMLVSFRTAILTKDGVVVGKGPVAVAYLKVGATECKECCVLGFRPLPAVGYCTSVVCALRI